MHLTLPGLEFDVAEQLVDTKHSGTASVNEQPPEKLIISVVGIPACHPPVVVLKS